MIVCTIIPSSIYLLSFDCCNMNIILLLWCSRSAFGWLVRLPSTNKKKKNNHLIELITKCFLVWNSGGRTGGSIRETHTREDRLGDGIWSYTRPNNNVSFLLIFCSVVFALLVERYAACSTRAADVRVRSSYQHWNNSTYLLCGDSWRYKLIPGSQQQYDEYCNNPN